MPRMTSTVRLTSYISAVLAALSGCDTSNSGGGGDGATGLLEAGDATAAVIAPDAPPDTTVGDAGFDRGVEGGAPDNVAPSESGADSASPFDAGPGVWANWPACACDYSDQHNPTALPVPDDGGSCPTFVWSHSEACDQCIRLNCDGPPSPGQPPFLFPPCCDLARDGGVAQAGPAAGTPRFQLCANLFFCILDNLHPPIPSSALYCGNGVTTADCESGKAAGPCKGQIEAAFESTDPMWIINNFTSNGQGDAGNEGTEVTNLLADCAAARANCPTVCFMALNGG